MLFRSPCGGMTFENINVTVNTGAEPRYLCSNVASQQGLSSTYNCPCDDDAADFDVVYRLHYRFVICSDTAVPAFFPRYLGLLLLVSEMSFDKIRYIMFRRYDRVCEEATCRARAMDQRSIAACFCPPSSCNYCLHYGNGLTCLP